MVINQQRDREALERLELTYGVSGVIDALNDIAKRREKACLHGSGDGWEEWRRARQMLTQFTQRIAAVLQEDK